MLHSFSPQLVHVNVALGVMGLILGAVAVGANRYAAEKQRPRTSDEPRISPLFRLLLLLRHVPDPVEAIRRRRRARVRSAPFPAAWRDILLRNVALYTRLLAPLQRALEGHVQVLLAEKSFEGCGGLVLTDEIRVTIAAHAGLLLLGDREPRYFPDLVTILVYPSAYRAPVGEEHDGIVTEREQGRLGESWRRGVVVLAWDAARAGARNPRDGDNVILHEFAHQLDTEDGSADGVPSLALPGDYVAWARALAPEYERLRKRPRASVLDPYGATNPAEFFAVATETFFERPHQLRQHDAAMYEELRKFYRLDPAALSDAPGANGSSASAAER